MRPKSLVDEAREIRLAGELIRLGARLQVLESETRLPRERLLRLYREIAGRSPSKGMLPFSTDWFMSWQPNVHASLFMNIYQALIRAAPVDSAEALAGAWRLYREQVEILRLEPVLSITRAWRLVKFFECRMLTMAECTRCRGQFVAHADDLLRGYVCGLCHMPSRAGKSRRAPPPTQH